MKTRTKKWLKICAPIAIVGAFVSIIISISGAFVKTPTVSIGGSTAVLPLMNRISNEYKGIDIVTSAGGSGLGINSIINGTKEIGMASKNPGIVSLEKNDDKYKKWEEKEIKTLTIAWDGIAIIYKPSSMNDELDINKDNILKIYSAFSGVEKVTLGTLLGNQDKNELIPYARNGGANVSGTAAAFLEDSHFENIWTDETKKIKEILESGNYGKNIVQTAEANSQAWNRIKNGPVGSITYLSSGFVLNNLKEINEHGFKVATYNGEKLSKENIAIKYNWYRPFNLIYSIKQLRNNKSVIDMFSWIFDDLKVKNIIESEGYVPLTDEQKRKMGWELNSNKWLVEVNYCDTKLGYSGVGESK